MSISPVSGFTGPDDEATRYLAAAAHLHPGFAEAVIAETLSEPYRSVPPTPGLRAELVAREAVTAQALRHILNAALLVFMVVFFLFASMAAMGWLTSAVAWRISSWILIRTMRRVSRRQDVQPNWPAIVMVWIPVNWVVSIALWAPLIVIALLSVDHSARRSSRTELPSVASRPDAIPVRIVRARSTSRRLRAAGLRTARSTATPPTRTRHRTLSPPSLLPSCTHSSPRTSIS